MRTSAIRYGVIGSLVVLTAVLDLASKRWVERNLATERHLLVVRADAPAPGATAGDVVRGRFPDLSDDLLDGALHRLPPLVELKPDDPVFELETRGLELLGFFVIDGGDPAQPFARRLDRSDGFAIERWVLKARPDAAFPEVRRAVRAQLAAVTVKDWLGGRLPNLGGETLDATVARGLYPIPKSGTAIRPSQPAVAGEAYLVGARQVDVVPGHLDLSYAENPNGAWGLLADLDPGTRRALFFVLSLVAIAAIIALIVKPPSGGWLTPLALGGILGGAVGNLADRFQLTYVVDFIHMHWEADWLPSWLVQDWPRYNVADIGITVGVVMLVLVSLFRKEPKADGGGAAAPTAPSAP